MAAVASTTSRHGGDGASGGRANGLGFGVVKPMKVTSEGGGGNARNVVSFGDHGDETSAEEDWHSLDHMPSTREFGRGG